MKELWKKIVTCVVLGMLLAGSTVSICGCREDSALEEAAEDTGEAIEDAGEAAGEAIEDAGDAIKDAVD